MRGKRCQGLGWYLKNNAVIEVPKKNLPLMRTTSSRAPTKKVVEKKKRSRSNSEQLTSKKKKSNLPSEEITVTKLATDIGLCCE
jgi:hypothetical protein